MLRDNKLPLHRGYELNEDDRIRRDVISSLMCHERIHIPDIEQAHGIKFDEYFADALRQLQEPVADKLVKITDTDIILLPKGNLMMRNVAMAFDAYLGDNQQGRFSRTV
jgi:oxygen-independent coproporphyrinogen-3 oxidase